MVSVDCKAKATSKVYGYLWKSDGGLISRELSHFDRMQEVIGEKIVRGAIGIDVGSGCGKDTHAMAKSNPLVKVVSMDLSDGVYVNSKINASLDNVSIVKGSVSEMPFKDKMFDFAYSFGVLHHTSDPGRSLLEVSRVIKEGSPVFLYLYEDHSDNLFKYIVLRVITIIRKVTVKLPPALLYFLSLLASPFIFLVFSLPSKFLVRFSLTRKLAENMPFNFARSPFSLQGDLYDRFAAPVEFRYSSSSARLLMESCNFLNIRITRLKSTAGLVVWGYKKG